MSGTTKRQLAAHIHNDHPEVLYPDTVARLMTWTRDELEQLHRDSHANERSA